MSRTRADRGGGWPPAPEPLPGPVVDNHTHVDTVLGFIDAEAGQRPRLPPRTLEDHLALAASAGVTGIVQIGCDLDSARWTDDLVRPRGATAGGVSAEWAPAGEATIGVTLVGGVAVHPNEAVLHAGVREVAPDGLAPAPEPRHDVPLDEAIARVAALAAGNERILVVGETGLDHFRAGERGRVAQRESFRAHIALAKELDLVLQIHDRDAHEEVVDVLVRDGAPSRTVFHCFSGDAAMARVCAEHGWYLSFAGPISFRANEALRDAARAVPADLLLVETDAPYLTAHPLRGRPNAPYLLPHTVRALADALGSPVEELCATLRRTSRDVYGI